MIKTMVKIPSPAATAFPSTSVSSLNSHVQQQRASLSPTDKLVLVIDGSPTIQKIIEITLRSEGYEVCCFRNGIDAMRWFAGPEARTPDLMLVDLDLPKLDGYHVIQKFKAKPRFAYTACLVLCESELASEAHLENVGAAGSLRKPFTIQELVTTVQASITNKLALVH